MSIDLSSVSHSFASPFQLDDDNEAEGLSAVAVPKKVVFGRTEEIATLLESYQCLLETKQPQTIVVHGKSGSGKTALVATLLGPVFDTSGYFVSGKYFQNEAVQEPFSAIMAAFSDLCDLVAQAEDFDELKQQQIATSLDAHARLLVKAITNFSSLTGVTISEAEIEVSSIVKFKIACKAFLHTLASYDHPIVIFLDDIQWADEGSVALIQMFLQDAGLTNVMLILAYRDEESELVEDITFNSRELIDIGLSDLDADGVLLMVNFIMGAATEEIKALSELVLKRTSGNPFHVATFLDTIEREGLMMYDCSTSSWLFDVDEIRQSIMVSETLADLLTRKIGRISGDIKESLKVASLLGYHFDDSVLQSVVCTFVERHETRIKSDKAGKSDSSCSTTTSVIASLSEGVKEGFIEKTSNGYQFTHDKLQSALQSLISNSEENELHQLIGEVFLKERAQERSYIYKAAVHLNVVPISLDRQDRAKLAQINLDAAKYCVEISAFGRAIIALRYGMECFNGDERWSEEYSPLTFEIMEALARNQLIVGEFEACKQTTTEALCHSMETNMKVRFQLIDVEVRLAGNELDDSREMANRSLATLGIKMPRKAKARHILAKLLRVKWMLRNKTDDDILNLPPTQDPLVSDATRLLMTICSNDILNGERETAIFCALVTTELTLKQGLSVHSPGAFALYGLVEVGLGNYARAYRFGKLALAMLDRMESREAECSTVSLALTMLIFRREPFRDLVDPLALAAKSGFRYGDISYATFGIVQCHNLEIHLGSNLATLESAVRASYATISEIGEDGLLMLLQPTMQYVLNMRADVNSWENMSLMTGEIMNETQFLARASERDETLLVMVTYLRKARIACDFGQFQLAESFFDTLTKTFGKDAVKFTFSGPPYYWDVVRTYLSLYRSSRQRHYLRKGRRFMKRLQKMANDGCPDASVRLIFLNAQEAAVRKQPLDDSTLRATYLHALNCLSDNQYFHLEGLLSEDAGYEFESRGLRDEAKVFFDRALHIYGNEWGATAKYNQLSQIVHFSTQTDNPTNQAISGMCINVART